MARSKTMKGLVDALRAHPTGFWFIFWGELAERAAYYGMRAILALFLVDVMNFDEGKSGMIASFFSAACYFLCLVGGHLSDRYFGKFWTIIMFTVPYLLGYPLLGFSTADTSFILYIALGLLAIGSGVIKPNLSPLMGSMYKDEKLRSQAFAWFYAAINLGAGATSLAMPWIRTNFGFPVAFYSTAGIMAAAFLIFFLGKRFYPPEEVKFGGSNVEHATSRSDEEKNADRAVLRRLFGVFFMFIFFWAIYDQTMSTWIFFARDHINLRGLDPDQFQALNPWLIVLLATPFAWLWNKMKVTKATTKMMVGYFLTAICMGTIALAGFIAGDGRVNMAWIIGAYTVVTLAELCISIVGLEFAYSEAPLHMKSQLTSYFLLTVFFGDTLAGLLAGLYTKMS